MKRAQAEQTVPQRVDWAASPWVWVLTFRRVADGGVWHGTERPIIFSARMINALIANAKTQTRRLNGLPNADPDRPNLVKVAYQARWTSKPGSTRRTVAIFRDSIPDDPVPLEIVCPFGNVGDRLWVREGVRRNTPEQENEAAYAAQCFPAGTVRGSVAHYIADGAATTIDNWGWKNKALPAIHMPRGVCRIVLEITDIRCERLQQITEADAKAEGAAHRLAPGGDLADVFGPGPIGYRAHFRDLWSSIHGEAP